MALVVFGATDAQLRAFELLENGYWWVRKFAQPYRAYDRQESRSFVRLQSTALAVTGGLIAAIIVAFALVSASGLIGSAWLPASPWVERMVDAVSTAIFGAMSAAVVASLYRWAPDCPSARWRWISPGTVLTAVVWLVLSTAFSAYATNIGKFGAAYGSLGAIVALLTWLYFSSLALFTGASLNRAIEEGEMRNIPAEDQHPAI